MTLDELAIKYQTDKRSDQHGYTRMYESLFKTVNIKSLLEVGLLGGASMKMWREYLPDAKLYCMEYFAVDRKQFFPDRTLDWNGYKGEDIEGMTLFSGDSTVEASWADVPYDIDILIDDGSHKPNDQMATFLLGFNHVASGGLYFIEDTHAFMVTNEYRGNHFLYDWLFDLIMKQQSAADNSGSEWSFERARENMDELVKNIHGYYAFKSVIVFEKW